MHEVFLRAAFKELDIDLTIRHLNALIEISQHPTIAAAVKKLHLVGNESWPSSLSDEDSDEDITQSQDMEHVQRGAGTALLMTTMEGLRNVTGVNIQPVRWVRGDRPTVRSLTDDDIGALQQTSRHGYNAPSRRLNEFQGIPYHKCH